MGFLDKISSDIDYMQRRSFNAQFGGGCPLCKGENSLERRRLEDGMKVVCGGCEAVFENVFFNGIKLIKGDARYAGEVFPINVWRMIRFLPPEDRVLAVYSDNFVNFYATSVGIAREYQSFSFLRYNDISSIQLVNTWALNIFHLAGFIFFLVIGLLVAIMMAYMFSEGAVFFSLPLLAIAFFFLLLGRKWVYQIYSPLLSKKELKDWRLKKTKSGESDVFVSVVNEQLRPDGLEA